jgi:hypothetical protein
MRALGRREWAIMIIDVKVVCHFFGCQLHDCTGRGEAYFVVIFLLLFASRQKVEKEKYNQSFAI